MPSSGSPLSDDATTPAGKRSLSGALASEMLWRFARLGHGEEKAKAIMVVVTHALSGERIDGQNELDEYARSAIASRNLIQKYLEEYHSDMLKLGASQLCCARELRHAVQNILRIGLVGAEAVCATKH